MRTAVVYFVNRNRNRLLEITKSLAQGIQGQGHLVDIIDGNTEHNARLTVYEYIVVGIDPASLFSGKIPDKVSGFLSSSGIVSGKKSFAFVLKSGFGSSRTLTRLMKVMEHEGMFLKNSGILGSVEAARETGSRLRI